jgi:hypothetical protein
MGGDFPWAVLLKPQGVWEIKMEGKGCWQGDLTLFGPTYSPRVNY